jgi:hypothetical protein
VANGASNAVCSKTGFAFLGGTDLEDPPGRSCATTIGAATWVGADLYDRLLSTVDRAAAALPPLAPIPTALRDLDRAAAMLRARQESASAAAAGSGPMLSRAAWCQRRAGSARVTAAASNVFGTNSLASSPADPIAPLCGDWSDLVIPAAHDGGAVAVAVSRRARVEPAGRVAGG